MLLGSCFSYSIYYGLLAFIVSLYVFVISVNIWKTILLYNLTIKNDDDNTINDNSD